MQTISRPSPGIILKAAGVPAFLVSDLTNIRYLTGLHVSAGLLLVSKNGLELFVDSRYAEAAVREARKGMKVRSADEFQKTMRTVRRVGIESEHVTLKRFGAWQKKFKNTKFVQVSDLLSGLRRSKYPDEIHEIHRACGITLSVLKEIPGWLKTGITEKQLSWRIESECRDSGGGSMAFESIVAFGEHSSSPHHHPTDRRLRKTDIVQIDMGAKAGDYCSDYSRVFFMTTPTPKQAKAFRALKKAKKAAEKLVRPGVSNRTLDEAARRSLKADGYEKEFSHALGHGVGLDIHEGVTISSKAPVMKLKKNEVITIEPGLYFPGEFGMRLEDTIVVS